ncbi:MAG: hypothetical protein CSB44_09770 [Gammaproteobacteria bacterium]|nr:MAG: hypothetical protein CSB44_09770 [Gammaproteobacteria bacterium]PIE36357.1 MAG: hypothetical protein CSA54_04675 [Gammaproteobacteria bacterium]
MKQHKQAVRPEARASRMRARPEGHRRVLSWFLLALALLTVVTVSPDLPANEVAEGHAEALPAPEGEVLLELSGNLNLPNVEGNEVWLDRRTLENFPRVKVSYTSFVSGKRSLFEGLLLKDLLDAVGSDSDEILAYAADDYHATLMLSAVDLARYPVIIAYREDDRDLTLRSLGPLRIIFPFDDFPELVNEANRAATVWQLTRLELR